MDSARPVFTLGGRISTLGPDLECEHLVPVCETLEPRLSGIFGLSLQHLPRARRTDVNLIYDLAVRSERGFTV